MCDGLFDEVFRQGDGVPAGRSQHVAVEAIGFVVFFSFSENETSTFTLDTQIISFDVFKKKMFTLLVERKTTLAILTVESSKTLTKTRKRNWKKLSCGLTEYARYAWFRDMIQELQILQYNPPWFYEIFQKRYLKILRVV